jgi:protein SCO1
MNQTYWKNMTRIKKIRYTTWILISLAVSYKIIKYFVVKNDNLFEYNASSSFPNIGGNFSAKTTKNNITYNTSEHKELLHIVYFGYTYCPDICPDTLAKLSKVYDKLGAQKNLTKIMFVTVDTKRDTLEKLLDFSKDYNNDFIFCLGNEKLKKKYKIYANEMSKTSEQSYLIDHSSLIYFMKNGKVIHAMPHTSDVDQILQTIRKMVS